MKTLEAQCIKDFKGDGVKEMVRLLKNMSALLPDAMKADAVHGVNCIQAGIDLQSAVSELDGDGAPESGSGPAVGSEE